MNFSDKEKYSPTELITPQAIKDRVMEFFEGVDLQKIGETRLGVLIIKTKRYPTRDPIIEHSASVNGLEAAYFQYIDPNVSLEPLEEGKYRQIASYRLHGYREGRGEASASYTEYEGKPSEIRIYSPPTAMSGGREGLINTLHEDYQRDVAEILEIKI